MRIAVVGASGMVGHMMCSVLRENGYEVHGYSRSKAATVDCVMTFENLKRITSDVIINCVGILNKNCENDTENALEVNGLLPQKLMQNCDHLIQVSTDCVFDGTRDFRSVKETPDAVTMYGRTKAIGEIAEDPKAVTLRQSIIGPSLKKNDQGFLHWALTQPKDAVLQGYTNHTWNGITTLELARIIARILQAWGKGKKIHGLYHCVTEQSTTKYEMLQMIQRQFGCEWRVEPIETLVPMYRCLAWDERINRIKPLTEQIYELKTWMQKYSGRRDQYRHYGRLI